MMKIRKIMVLLSASLLILSLLSACEKAAPGTSAPETEVTEATSESKAPDTSVEKEPEPETMAESPSETEIEKETESEAETSAESAGETEPAPVEKNGDVYILFTSDIHCGVDQGFGLAGLKQVRDSLEQQGYTTILVDNGDAIQGEVMGTLSQGETMIRLMNTLHYDVAIPGNHEFDYGTERFLELTEMAEFPYISCNLMKEDEPVFEPYVILEAAGMKIAFVGMTTPKSITSSTPVFFQNEQGELIYSFLQDEDGSATYADVIEHTRGIDVFLDGHSHDTEQVVMKNLDGENVVRSACGTKLSCIGYSYISAEKGISDTGIWSWPNKTAAFDLFGIENEASAAVAEAFAEMNEVTSRIVAKSNVELTVNDPEETDETGNPIRMIRRAETNLGDFCADAFLAASGADIAIMNGGGIRTDIKKGDITYGDIINVFPFGNEACVIKATGQQILDALEWGARSVPSESGSFLQVAGMSYEIDVTVPNPCITSETGMCAGIEGERRVKNVLVGGEPIDPEGEYTLAGTNYTLRQNGDGQTAFDGAELLIECVAIDNQLLIDFITETLGGEIGGDYADPYGQGRITIMEE